MYDIIQVILVIKKREKEMKFDKKEVNLLQEAGANAEEGKEYTEEELKVFGNEVISYIMNHSKNEISKVRNKYNVLLQKID
jgi:hypothetical protein